MPYVPNCCCDRDGLCTTRWYPLQGVTYFGNPDDCFTYDHGTGTTKVATFHLDTDWYNFILGGNKIAKLPIPDGADPIAAWKRSIMYSPPDDAVGESQGEGPLQIYEMRSVDGSFENAVAIGTLVNTRLNITGDFPVWFDYDSVQISTLAISAVADEVGKYEIKFASSSTSISESFIEVSTGGFFRCEVNQWLGDLPCGIVAFVDDDSVGTAGWSNPDGAETAGGGEAVSEGQSEFSHYLRGYIDFALCIPDDALSIQGVTVEITRFADEDGGSAYVRDEVVSLTISGGLVGSNKGKISLKWPTTPGTATYGGSSDLWGATISVEDARNNLGMVLQAEFGPNGADGSVDLITMTIDYTDANGDPQTATTSDIVLQPPTYPAYTNFSDDGDVHLPGSGMVTDYLTEPIPFSTTGAGLAAIIQTCLDDRYTVSGSGSLGESSSITLTFTHDGSIDPDIAAPGGVAKYLAGLAVLHAFPNEAASVHMIDQNGEIQWSRCGTQKAHFDGYTGNFSGGLFGIRSRLVQRVNVNTVNENIAVYGGGNYPINLFDFDGSPQDNGAYTAIGAGIVGNRTTNRRGWILIDWSGYGWSQDEDNFAITRYGPEGIDAEYTADWTLAFPYAVTHSTVGDGFAVVAGRDPDTGDLKVSLVTTAGVLGWTSGIPSNGTWNKAVYDLWSDGTTVAVSANYGVYEFEVATGDLLSYFPHGASCRSAMRIITDADDFLVLTGGTAEIDIDPSLYDIDPETLT